MVFENGFLNYFSFFKGGKTFKYPPNIHWLLRLLEELIDGINDKSHSVKRKPY